MSGLLDQSGRGDVEHLEAEDENENEDEDKMKDADGSRGWSCPKIETPERKDCTIR